MKQGEPKPGNDAFVQAARSAARAAAMSELDAFKMIGRRGAVEALEELTDRAGEARIVRSLVATLVDSGIGTTAEVREAVDWALLTYWSNTDDELPDGGMIIRLTLRALRTLLRRELHQRRESPTDST